MYLNVAMCAAIAQVRRHRGSEILCVHGDCMHGARKTSSYVYLHSQLYMASLK